MIIQKCGAYEAAFHVAPYLSSRQSIDQVLFVGKHNERYSLHLVLLLHNTMSSAMSHIQLKLNPAKMAVIVVSYLQQLDKFISSLLQPLPV